MSKAVDRALARRQRLHGSTRCVAAMLRPPLGWLRIKSACDEPIQTCQTLLCPDVVEAANLAIRPRRGGAALRARHVEAWRPTPSTRPRRGGIGRGGFPTRRNC